MTPSNPPSNLPFAPMPEPMSPPVPPQPARPPMPPMSPAPVMPAAPATPPPSVNKVEDLFAGIETPPPVSANANVMGTAMPPVPVSTGGAGKIIAIILIVLILAAGGVGAWYVWSKKSMDTVLPIPTATSTSTDNTYDEPVIPPPVTSSELGTDENVRSIDDVEPIQVVPLPAPVTTPPAGSNVPLPNTQPNNDAPIMPTAPAATSSGSVQFDSDGDGLTDQREAELGTDPLKTDTDADTLNDGDEVLKYGTNPLNADTDGDGFPDGVERQNGFNPRGTGKCAKPSCEL